MPEAPNQSPGSPPLGTLAQATIDPTIEPWMRGPISGVDPLLAPLLYSFQQAREDLARWTSALTVQQVWATPQGFGSVGFHLRHIAGSTGRLITYLLGEQLSPEQLVLLKSEHEPGATLQELLSAADSAFNDAERIVRSLQPASLPEPRGVGRKQFPTTVIGLLFHIAEHTQRHVGQAISAAKWARLEENPRLPLKSRRRVQPRPAAVQRGAPLYCLAAGRGSDAGGTMFFIRR